MGIHKFFAFLKRTFPTLVAEELILPVNSFTEGLYVDLNSPIHNICQRIFKYGLSRDVSEEDLEFRDYLRAMTPDERKYFCFKCIGIFLYFAYVHVKPLKTFMFAVDGVPPKSKMIQQRLRRFKYDEATLDIFDASMISVGTPFMDELDGYLRGEWLQTYRPLIPGEVQIIYSSHRDPGEGEHKIFEQLQTDLRGIDRVRTDLEFKQGKKNAYQVILGADSDLIVVSLIKNYNIIFMRDAFFNNKQTNSKESNSEKDESKGIDKESKGKDERTDKEKTDKQRKDVKPKWKKDDKGSKDVLEMAIDHTFRVPSLQALVQTEGQDPRKIQEDLDKIQKEHAEKWTTTLSKGYNYVNVTEMRHQIQRTYLQPIDISDFMFMSIFVGNDFLPPMPEFEAVTVLSYQYFEDADVYDHFFKIDRWVQQQGQPPQIPTAGRGKNYKGSGGSGGGGGGGGGGNIDDKRKKFVPFDQDKFQGFFEKASETWNLDERGLINFKDPIGLLNRKSGAYEIFPFVSEPLTGKLRRARFVKTPGTHRWIPAKDDVGALIKIMRIYRNFTAGLVGNRTGSSETFIIERKSHINYINLLKFLKELQGYGSIIMEASVANYKELEKKGLTPDPLVLQSLGIDEKKNRIKSLVPAAYTNLYRAKSFGIYDQRFADVNLPKRAQSEMCRKWLEGAQWTVRYYSEGHKSVSTEWFYPYFHSPSLHDLIIYLEDRINLNVAGYPGIGFTLNDHTVSVERISIASRLRLIEVMSPDQLMNQQGQPINQEGQPISDPETVHEMVLDRLFNGIIYIYSDTSGKKIALYILPGGNSKFVDLDQIHFTKPGPLINQTSRSAKTPIMSMSSQVALSQGKTIIPDEELIDVTVETVDPSKSLTLIETNRDYLTIPVQAEFVLEKEIFEVISDISKPYASVTECLFSILPARVLKIIYSPYLVDFVISELSDCFPLTYESITEGKFYDNDSVPRISFPSPTRIQRAIDLVPKEFDIEIARRNNRRKRELFIINGKYGPEVKDIRINRGRGKLKEQHGSAAPNVAVHTKKKQGIQPEEQTELSKHVIGGIGDVMGGVLPQFEEYYKSLFRKGKNPIDEVAVRKMGRIYTSRERDELEFIRKQILQIPSAVFNPIQFPININNLKTNFLYHEWASNTAIGYNGQRKLLINEVLFLTKHGQRARKVVYAGAAPGHHIPVLCHLFPYLEFDLWDPRFDLSTSELFIPPEYIKGVGPRGRLSIIARPFLHKDALAYRGQNVLFISDLRDLSTEDFHGQTGAMNFQRGQMNIINDNNIQSQYISLMLPVCTMLKFKVPFEVPDTDEFLPTARKGLPEGYSRDKYGYLKGEIWLQPWSKATSAESRLIIDSVNYIQTPKTDIWNNIFSKPAVTGLSVDPVPGNVILNPPIELIDLRQYENAFFYFNTYIRRNLKILNSVGIQEGEVRGSKFNFDCSYEIYAWEQWIFSAFGQNITTLEQRKQMIIIILNMIEKFMGKDMSSEIAHSRHTQKLELPPFLPAL